jgi:hypothetical protein
MRTNRRARGMSALYFRPVHLLAHPIGGRYNIPRVFEQGRKGDRSDSFVILRVVIDTRGVRSTHL